MSNQDIQYVAKRDAAGTWRILDTWDESLSSIADDEEISDSNPSVTMLTEGQSYKVLLLPSFSF